MKKVTHALAVLLLSCVAVAQQEISINLIGGLDTSGTLGQPATGFLEGGVYTVTFSTGPSLTYDVTPEGIHGDFFAQSTYGEGGWIHVLTASGSSAFTGTFTEGESSFNFCPTAGPACLIEGIGASFTGEFADGVAGFGTIGAGGDHVQTGGIDVTPTPEPASVILLASGGLALWLRRHGQRL